MTAWRPGTTPEALRARAELFAEVRRFFAERDVLEVDTPLVSRYGVTDPAIEPLLLAAADTSPRFLQTSPEFAMKRLLAAGSGPIYQLSHAFRAGEAGARHNPEFMLLEWYRPGFTLDDLMGEVAALVARCLKIPGGASTAQRRTYAEVFREHVGLDPHRARDADLAAAAAGVTDTGGLDLDRDGWLDLLMSHVVEPALRGGGLVFVHAYPASQAALARCLDRDGMAVADRFELYVDGVEVANGYRELRDPEVLARRAAQDNRRRRAAGQAVRDLDPRLVQALEAGLPDCSGVALGVDRLLMAARGEARIDAVLPFPWERA